MFTGKVLESIANNYFFFFFLRFTKNEVSKSAEKESAGSSSAVLTPQNRNNTVGHIERQVL